MRHVAYEYRDQTPRLVKVPSGCECWLVEGSPMVQICYFFFNDPATPDIYTCDYTLSLHDALPISARRSRPWRSSGDSSHHTHGRCGPGRVHHRDRKSTRLNSSHSLTSRMPSS